MTASPWRDAPVDLRVEVTPPWPFRIGRGSGDGILRRRGATLMRLLHVGEEPVLVAVAQTAPQRVLFAARSDCETAAAAAIERMRFATGVDDDLRPFYERFADDPVIGKAVRSRPHVRIHRRADPWEALAWSITEQLIELERALVIQRRLVFRLGRRCPHSGLRDMPTPAAVAALAPAELQSYDLAAQARAGAPPRRAGDRRGPDRPRRPRRRLAAAARDPERRDVDARDALAVRPGPLRPRPGGRPRLLKLVGRLTTGHPKARADEAEVRGFFERYGEWKGLAGTYLIIAAGAGLLTERRSVRGSSPSPGRNSLVSAACRVRLPLEQPALEHPVAVGVPLGRLLPAERLVLVRREEDGQRGADDRGLQPALEAGIDLQQRVDAGLRVLPQALVAARGGAQEAPQLRGEALVEVLAADDHHSSS